MQKQTHPAPVSGSCSPPPPNQPSMARQQQGPATPTGRSGGGAGDARPHTDAEDRPVPSAPEDFEFCILSSGGLALAGSGDGAADMCVADEVFSGGKLLPLRLSSAKPADAPAPAAASLLLRSDSLDGAATAASTSSSSGASSRSVSRSASSGSSSSSSSCASRSASAKSAPPAAVPQRRSLSSSVFYAHPSPSPRPPRRSSAAAPAPRRSTGSAPPAAWGVIRLGVVGAPEVYAPRPAEHRRPAAKESGRVPGDKKLALGLLGAGLVCSCSPDAVAPVGSAEVAAAEARRRRKKAEAKKGAAKQSGRSRILEWLEELAISKEKSVV
ncbi:hypothetical protein BS78_01G316400 [Paspalum vaginatum]|nr:hypothetical protein BS78_01G316400 [Paspalum vaginatum]